jgi:LacI family transcriptional regulator
MQSFAVNQLPHIDCRGLIDRNRLPAYTGGMRSRPTLRQISDIAGVSPSTVSRILSGADFRVPIAPHTRERVLKVVAELGYTPNPLARALRSARSALLGLIVRDVSDPFFAIVIEAITNEARHRGYGVVLGNAQSRAREAVALQETLATWHCDALILLGDLRDQPTLMKQLLVSELPLVALCQGSRAPRMPVVNVDNVAGSRMVLELLHDLGHRRIAFVRGGWIFGDARERQAAYRVFLRERGLPLPRAYIQASDNDLAGGLKAALALLSLPQPPTAIYAASDKLALGVLKGAATRGVRVPDELSVVGFDDIPMAAYAIPSLTTVRQPVEQMARLAVETALGLIGRPSPAPSTRIVPPELVQRDSCASPR